MIPKPDVVVVCCGGGGLLAGVAAAIKLSGCDGTRIYGVEPDGGKTSTQNGIIYSFSYRPRATGSFSAAGELWACCVSVQTQPAPCTGVSLRRSQWVWRPRASPQVSLHLLQVSCKLFLSVFLSALNDGCFNSDLISTFQVQRPSYCY